MTRISEKGIEKATDELNGRGFNITHVETREAITAYLDATDAPASDSTPAEWRDIASAPSATPLLVAYKNRCDKWRVVKAVRYEQYQNEQPVDNDEGEVGEYCEEKDAYFVRAGWYELIDNWDDFGFVSIYEGEPVAWQHLPTAPKGKHRARFADHPKEAANG